MKLKELHVAIPRGGLGTGVAMYIRFEDLMSPSHTVGSELKRDWDLGGRGGVAIPHGGLRTEAARKKDLKSMLQVTIPHGGLGTQRAYSYVRILRMSPSHTVGLEPQILEQSDHRKQVTIPHGGLRTRVVLFLRPHMIPGAIPPSGLRTFEDGQNDMEVRLSLKASPSHTVGLEHDY